jgi:heme-degrading monooxygenase HmoA
MVMAAWAFEAEPAQIDEILRRVTLALERAPKLPGWLSTNVFANEKRTRVLILSKWDSKESWGHSMWDEEIGRALADFVTLSRDQHFELYFQIAPEGGR